MPAPEKNTSPLVSATKPAEELNHAATAADNTGHDKNGESIDTVNADCLNLRIELRNRNFG